jgi:hypothetical protein
MTPNITTILAIIAGFSETWHSIALDMPYSMLQAFHCVQGQLPRLTAL